MMLALAGLFAAAFLAATPAPFQSEIVFLAMQAAGWPATALIVTASLGNTLGSCVTYGLGRALADLQDHPRFPLTRTQMARAERWFQRWGVWVLLLSWAPGGDLVVAMAGVLRVPVWTFMILVSLAKTGRYVALAWIGAQAIATVQG